MLCKVIRASRLLQSETDLYVDLVLNTIPIDTPSLFPDLEPLDIAERFLSTLYGPLHSIIKIGRASCRERV